MQRRGFLQALLALGVAPAYVRADNLMKGGRVLVPERYVWTPGLDEGVVVVDSTRAWPGSFRTLEEGLEEVRQTRAAGIVCLERNVSTRTIFSREGSNTMFADADLFNIFAIEVPQGEA